MDIASNAKRLSKLLYWKLCFPDRIALIPPDITVTSGPFAGMHYSHLATGSAVSAKVLGTYERELHPVIAKIQSESPYDTLIDIGAAEGYYVVGLGLTACPLSIVAFEMQDADRMLMQKLVLRNRIPSVTIKGRCEPEELKTLLESSGRTLMICDVEGYESSLLDPQAALPFQKTTILVELHDFLTAGVTNLIKSRFEPSHRIEEIFTSERTWSDFPRKNVASRLLPRHLAIRAMNEGRSCKMSWLWMKPLDDKQ